ncbi:MFS transporter [Microbacterium mangrovi]|uniref:MFS transporter n=1 Tax=Microbacterium mangrovi TaxID=1348253 RepID=A0A0B2A451_9MICO|nr:MFS transporter [Microbacterium mangrovi]KHK96392.1 MFS transporter [Microbacterium mangrovi]
MSSSHAPQKGSILKQPAAVWAVAFSSVIAFMGIGLVDPILPAIAKELQATPTQTEMLFTTYLFVTAIAMFFTSWVSSRIGAKKTLLIGLALIVVFATLAGLSDSIGAIMGFRAGWGLGNALYISTALATIIGASSGGTASAIILYEAALGLGIAIGPLLGGWLGSISWRGPFFGTAALMAIGFILIVTLMRKNPEKPAPTSLLAPFKALGKPALTILAVAAIFYNFGFFTLLAYSPFALVPLGIEDAQTLGFIFFGWGVALAVTSVWVAPLMTRFLPRTRVLWIVMVLLGLTLVAAGFAIGSVAGIIVCIIVGGLFLGVINTVLTECVMAATDLPRTVASSAYSGVRFLGGAIAPPLTTWLAAQYAPATPYFVGGAAVIVAALIIIAGSRTLAHVNLEEETAEQEAEVLALADAD